MVISENKTFTNDDVMIDVLGALHQKLPLASLPFNPALVMIMTEIPEAVTMSQCEVLLALGRYAVKTVLLKVVLISDEVSRQGLGFETRLETLLCDSWSRRFQVSSRSRRFQVSRQ